MALALQDFSTLVKTQAAAVNVSSKKVLDTTVGSVIRALLEANASIALWIQWLIVEVLSTTRAATSVADDLDTWVADFGMSRFAAVPATGFVTFSRVTPGFPSLIATGTLVRTGLTAGSQTFSVIADLTNPAWNGTGYVLPSTDEQVTCRVTALEAGSSGNVLAGAVTLLASAIPGVDTVTNASGISGGLDAETDSALRSRFAGFLDSRTGATNQAVGFAIKSVKQGISYTIVDREDAAGSVRPGHFTVTVDDGTGSPSDDFINQVSLAIDKVRPIGGTFSIRPPLIIPISVELSISGTSIQGLAVQAAVASYINSLPIGATLFVNRLYQIAFEADSRIVNASDASINGSRIDYVPPPYGLLRPASVLVHS